MYIILRIFVSKYYYLMHVPPKHKVINPNHYYNKAFMRLTQAGNSYFHIGTLIPLTLL